MATREGTNSSREGTTLGSAHEPQVTKTLVGVLASYDSQDKNETLARSLKTISKEESRFEAFDFLFTGGTFDRLFKRGLKPWESSRRPTDPLIDDPAARERILRNSTRLPERTRGGVTVLSNYLVSRQCGILLPFFDPAEPHWLNPENLALTRLCDVWQVKRLRNSGSLEEWFEYEAKRDAKTESASDSTGTPTC